MNISDFLLFVVITGQSVMGVVMLGSAFSWPTHKLSHDNLFFLIGAWLALLGGAISIISSGYSVNFNWLLGGVQGIALAALMLIAVRSKNQKVIWITTSIYCLLFTFGLALAIIS